MKVPEFLSGLFEPSQIQDLEIAQISFALSDASVRGHWLREIFKEIQSINQSIDSDLLHKKEMDVKEKSTRRRTLQFVLEQALSSKRSVEGESRHIPARAS